MTRGEMLTTVPSNLRIPSAIIQRLNNIIIIMGFILVNIEEILIMGVIIRRYIINQIIGDIIRIQGDILIFPIIHTVIPSSSSNINTISNRNIISQTIGEEKEEIEVAEIIKTIIMITMIDVID